MKKYTFTDGWTCNGKPVLLPHDAMLEEGRRPDSPSGSACAFYLGGTYTYEKVFEAPGDWKGKHLILHFEGIYQKSRVFLNDREIGGAIYGYIPFSVCLDEALLIGQTNHLKVTVDNSDMPNSRWYTGSGIYRPVYLLIGEEDYIKPYGVKITTNSIDPPSIQVHVDYTGLKTPQICIYDRKGNCMAAAKGPDATIDLPSAKLWSDTHPYLYTCKVTLGESGDEATETFGIRQITWNPTGLYINGKSKLLRGACIHHDNGILGAASYDGADYRRVKKLKEAGYNAIRSSHNPASDAVLKACDQLGVFLIDEGWDMWYNHKNPHDYASFWRKNHMSDLQTMIDHDYNHPSVIMYSMGNEVSEPAKDEGISVLKEMTDFVHEKDPSRAVTGGFNLMIIHSASKGKGIYDDESGGRNDDSDKKMNGMNSTMFNMVTNMVGTGMNKAANSKAADAATSPSVNLLDIAGYNYGSGRYPLEGKAHPNRVIYGSETFPQDIAKNWAMVKKYPYLVGDFMWTAWDYLGEAGIGAWAYTKDGKGFDKPYPWQLGDCGAFDILGNPGAPVAHAQAAWKLDEKPWIGVQPVNHGKIKPAKAVWRGTNAISSWSFLGCDGAKAIIEVYSSSDSVEVFLNSRKLGKKKLKECKATFNTKYQPGKLEVIAYDKAGSETGRNVLTTAHVKLQIQAIPEYYDNLCYLNINLADDEGTIECNADEKLTISVEGGTLLGFGSANPRTEESFLDPQTTTYYGRSLAIIRKNSPDDPVQVTMQGETLKSVTVTV